MSLELLSFLLELIILVSVSILERPFLSKKSSRINVPENEHFLFHFCKAFIPSGLM